MRVLIAVAPLMYREVFALAIHERRPDVEVLISPPAPLDGRAESFAPHLLVRNDAGEAAVERLTGALCRVEMLYGDSLDARVSLDGEVREIEDIGIDGLIEVIDRAEARSPEQTRAQADPECRATLRPLRRSPRRTPRRRL